MPKNLWSLLPSPLQTPWGSGYHIDPQRTVDPALISQVSPAAPPNSLLYYNMSMCCYCPLYFPPTFVACILLPFPAAQEGIAGQIALLDVGEGRVETRIFLFFISLLVGLGNTIIQWVYTDSSDSYGILYIPFIFLFLVPEFLLPNFSFLPLDSQWAFSHLHNSNFPLVSPILDCIQLAPLSYIVPFLWLSTVIFFSHPPQSIWVCTWNFGGFLELSWLNFGK